MIDADVLKTNDHGRFEGMYDSSFLPSNFKKLEHYYLKKLNHDDLDERFYIRDKKANTPGKFTPFAKQGAANKNINIQWNISKNDHPHPQKKAYNSHRMLNYEVSENVSMKSNLNEIVFISIIP